VHPRRFGYVVLETPDRLLDWGLRSCRVEGYSPTRFVRQRLRPPLDLWRPSVVVFKNPSRTTSKVGPRSLLNRLVREANSHGVQVRVVAKPANRIENLTKHENARRAAEQFSVLRWKMPPKRKPWESEDYRMSMFTAATLAMAQLNITIPSTPAIPGPLASPFSPKPGLQQISKPRLVAGVRDSFDATLS
jgi:hypothetical protein